jgi:hypothetical protein
MLLFPNSVGKLTELKGTWKRISLLLEYYLCSFASKYFPAFFVFVMSKEGERDKIRFYLKMFSTFLYRFCFGSRK